MAYDLSPSLVRLHGVERSDRVSTYAQVAALVSKCRDTLAGQNMPAKPSSAVGTLFAKADQLSREWSAGTATDDIVTLIKADEACRIAEAVHAAIGEPAAREAIRRITKSDMSLSTRQSSQGKDALWELSLITFLRARGVNVNFKDPPDLEIVLPGSLGPYGIACKKVYSEDSVEKQFSKGLKQIEPYGGAGLVAFNLDDLTPARSLLVAPTRAEALDRLHRLNADFIRRHQLRFQKAVMEGKCDGVWVASCAHADIAGLSPRFNRITEHTLWTVNEAGIASKIRLDAIRRLIDGSGS